MKNNKFKVNKKKFLNAITYIKQINEQDLNTLDLSNIFGKIDLTPSKKNWETLGLTNKDYILTILENLRNNEDINKIFN